MRPLPLRPRTRPPAPPSTPRTSTATASRTRSMGARAPRTRTRRTPTDDGIGDACDDCPDFSNPGGGGCPASIYDVHSGVIPVGDRPSVLGVVVTGVAEGTGLFVQLPTTAPDYDGPEHSGLFVYMPSAPSYPAVGDLVNVEGTIELFFGQTELTSPVVTPVDDTAPMPEPVLLTTTEIQAYADAAGPLRGRARARRRCGGHRHGAGGPGRRDGHLRVRGHRRAGRSTTTSTASDPPVVADQVIPGITGVLRWSWGRHKLNPRGLEGLRPRRPLPAGLRPRGWLRLRQPVGRRRSGPSSRFPSTRAPSATPR